MDNLDRVTRLTQSGGGALPKRVDLAYNGLDQLTGIQRYSDLAGTLLVVSTGFTYDLANRLTALAHTHGSTTLASYTFGFDAANRITNRTSPDGSSTLAYDAASELTSDGSATYSFDLAGNRNSTGYQTGAYHRLTADGRYTYQYDNEGNRTRRTDTTTGAWVDYTWDPRNRLTRALSKNSAGTVTADVRYTYDPLDQRIGKQVDANSDGTYETVEREVYAAGQVALRFDGSGTLQERTLYGPAVDQIFAEELGSTLQWPLADQQGSIRDVASNGGTVLNHVVLNSFGVRVSQTNASVPVRFLYTGREYDPETGLEQDRARVYDPAVGRFLSEDPSGLAAGDAAAVHR